jgi:hypothetical protein
MNWRRLSHVSSYFWDILNSILRIRLARDVATKLYPHQKKALTFLLERERESCAEDGYSSLWQKRLNPITRRTSWFHIVTQQEAFDQPQEAKGAILADDVCLSPLRGVGKTNPGHLVDGTW